MLRQFTATALIAVLLCTAQAGAQAVETGFVNGVDVSFLDHFERNGVTFKMDGEPADGLAILKENGVNLVRLRLWHTPPPDYQYNGLDRTLQMAQRIEEAGLAFMLDFHYSDWWADPGQQNVPAAWVGVDFESLKDSLQAYTRYVIERLAGQGTVPDIVQIGNEISVGMLWPFGNVGGSNDNPGQWARLADLILAADSGLVAGLRPGDDRPEVMIHTDHGGNPEAAQWFFDNLTNQGVDFDLIGLSYYPFWHGPLSSLEQTLQTTANRYGKDVVVAETAYPWTLQWYDNTHNFVGTSGQLLDGYPASPEGQYDFLVTVKDMIRAAPANHGRGLIYWEPTYVADPRVLGSPWENLTLFDQNFNALVGLSAFDDETTVSSEPVEVPGSRIELSGYPNPFRSTATIRLMLDDPEQVRIDLFDVTGRLVKNVVVGDRLAPGSHEFVVDGGRFPAGAYLARLVLQDRGQIRTLAIIKQP